MSNPISCTRERSRRSTCLARDNRSMREVPYTAPARSNEVEATGDRGAMSWRSLFLKRAFAVALAFHAKDSIS